MGFKFRLIHLEALVVYLVYSLITKYIFFRSIFVKEWGFAYLIQPAVTAFFAFMFLYVFDKDEFFRFAKTIERKEFGKEKKLEKEYLHYGKTIAVLIIEILSGPLLGALSAHFLLKRFKERYLLVVIAGFISGALWLFLFRGGALYFR